jgi:prepilin-type N-terminal cleavage/methylation domain-containing protein
MIKFLFKNKKPLSGNLTQKFEQEKIKSLLIKRRAKNSGFTLIELLVSIIMGSIILGSLLTFMNSVLSSERQDQAKVTTDQEIQSALDYIASDLQEAVYIYDATGIAAIRDELPAPTATDRVPVLVFWKRHLFDKDAEVTLSDDSTEEAGCIVKFSPTNTVCNESDYFVYSLVAYYLIKDSDDTWSDAARIGRYEIRDGIKDPNNTTTYLTKKSAAFKPFNLNESGTLSAKMNLWEKDSGDYPGITVLIDYLDQSTVTGVPSPSCSTGYQQVPASGTTANPTGIYSFYACIDSAKTLAQVSLRGNGLARIEPITRATYNANNSTYFPTGSIQVKGRGFINGE